MAFRKGQIGVLLELVIGIIILLFIFGTVLPSISDTLCKDWQDKYTRCINDYNALNGQHTALSREYNKTLTDLEDCRKLVLDLNGTVKNLSANLSTCEALQKQNVKVLWILDPKLSSTSTLLASTIILAVIGLWEELRKFVESKLRNWKLAGSFIIVVLILVNLGGIW